MIGRDVELTGRVVHDQWALGSKGERMTAVLKADDGGTYLLRRFDGPSMGDETLDELVGTRISSTGFFLGRTYVMRSWRVLPP